MKTRLRLILRTVAAGECEHYSTCVLPKIVCDVKFRNIIIVFLNTRWKYLEIKNNKLDSIIYAVGVHRECEMFKIVELSRDMFKWLIFSQGQISKKQQTIKDRNWH